MVDLTLPPPPGLAESSGKVERNIKILITRVVMSVMNSVVPLLSSPPLVPAVTEDER